METVEKIELTQEEIKEAEKFHYTIDRNMNSFHKWWIPSRGGMDTSVSEELNNKICEHTNSISANAAQVVGYYGLTIFHQLVTHNYYDAVKILLEKGVNPDVRGAEGKGDYTESHKGITPLHLACHAGNLKMVKLLLEHGADTTLCDDKGRNCFHFVASEYYRYVSDYSNSSEMGIVEQRIEITKLLKCDINKQDADGVTPLIRLMQNTGKKYTMSMINMFLEYGAEVMVADNKGYTALMYAVENKQTTATLILTKNHDLINMQDNDGDTALNKALFDNKWNQAAAYVLMEAGADINIKNNEGKSMADYSREMESESYWKMVEKCLYKKTLSIDDYFKIKEEFARDWWGGKDDDLTTFVHLIARKILRAIDKDDDTELVYAKELMKDLLWGRDEACAALQIFYEEGYDLCMPIVEGRQVTTLRDMCLSKVLDDTTILPKLKELGVDIDEAIVGGRTMANIVADRRVEQRLTVGYIGEQVDEESDYDKFAKIFDNFSIKSMEELNNEGKAAIHLAAENDSFSAIKKMAEMGVNMNLTTDSPSVVGNTPLHLACMNQCVEAVKALIEANADESIRNAEEETAAHSVFSDYRKFDGERSYEIIKVLNNVDEPMGKEGMTPFMLMLRKDPYNVKEFTELFMEKGVDLDHADNKGNTPLIIHADRRCDRDVIKMFIKAGADINARNEKGNSVLYYALKKGDCELARLLIKKGADYNVVNEDGKSPVDIAIENGYEVVLELMTDIKVHMATSDDSIRLEEDEGVIYRPGRGRYEDDYDDDYDDDDEDEEVYAMNQFETIVNAYSQMYGPEKARKLAELATRMGEMNEKGIVQDNMEEYTRLAEEFQRVLGS